MLLFAAAISCSAFSQPTHAITDPEKKFKDAKALFVQEEFALAYPLFAELKAAHRVDRDPLRVQLGQAPQQHRDHLR